MVNLKNQPNQKKKKLKSFRPYIQYSGLAFEMIIIILISVLGGIKLDSFFNLKPILTVLFSLMGMILALIFAIKDLLRK